MEISGISRFRWTPVSIFAAVLALVFLAQSVEQVWLGGSTLVNSLALSMEGLQQGQIWRLISYALLHDGFWHLLGNILALLFIGLALERDIGARATGVVLALFAMAGGLAFTLVHASTGGVLVGASAIGIGLLALYCLNYPDRPITLLLFFVLPVTILPRYVLYFTLGINLFGFLFMEIAPGALSNVGYSAHLGGMLAAWGVSRWCLNSGAAVPARPMKVQPPAWVKKKSVLPSGSASQPSYSVNLSSRSALQQEVDRILDKINTKGFGALTTAEKSTLDKAKDILGK
jgi:membrane associated rhomboid family serine protease